jgi:hypothetical protein
MLERVVFTLHLAMGVQTVRLRDKHIPRFGGSQDVATEGIRMVREMCVSDNVVIAATAEQIYRCISDPTQMGRWSEENTGATIVGDHSTGAYVGMHFEGHNKWNPTFRGRLHLVPSWTTRCVVTAADEPRYFAFRAWLPLLGNRAKPRLALRLATWEYRLDPVEGGTKVTETWSYALSDRIERLTRFLQPVLAGGKTAEAFQAQNIASTLRRLKADLESPG